MVICLSANTAKNGSFYKRRIVLLFGSPHHVGFTFRLVMQFLDTLEENSYVLEQFDLFEMDLLPCNDCENCRNGLCCLTHIDHYEEIIEAIQRADWVILASPVYCGGFPAPMKAMMDRANQFYVNGFAGRAQTFPQRKKGILLMTGGNCGKTLQQYLSIPARMFFDCINVQFCGQVIAGNTDQDPFSELQADFSGLLQNLENQ